jgi:hypothetical protein
MVDLPRGWGPVGPAAATPNTVSSMPHMHPRQPGHDGDSPSQAYLFVCEGEYWTITFDGRVGRFRHTRGFQHIARLLVAPGRPSPPAS